MIDVVIPLGTGSEYDNFELRNCLRSIEQYLIGVKNVFIIGECPEWVQNVFYIPTYDNQNRKWKDRNIYNKLLLACNDTRISEDFLFFNDDHYLTKPVQADEFPYYYRERDMLRTIDAIKNDFPWTESLRNTRDYLVSNNCDVKMFDMHCPIIYNKEKLKVLEAVNWYKEYGYGIKSLYCNLNKIEGVLQKDNRLFPYHNEGSINRRIKFAAPFFSTSPEIPPIQIETIKKLYPVPSKYETAIHSKTNNSEVTD